MKKFISLMNSQTFYYLWQDLTLRKYLLKMINALICENDSYTLLDTFSEKNSFLRSYIFLESDSKLIFIDFNQKENLVKYNLDLSIINYLKLTYKKDIYLIMFNNFVGKNIINDNIYMIFRNSNNDDFVKFLFSKNYKEQSSFKYSKITNYLYNLSEEFYVRYLNEIKCEENIYNLFDL